MASERPEDLRHERSAEALRKATALLHEWSPSETDLQYFAQFARVLERIGLDPDPELVLRHSTEAARRFSYDIGPPDVSDCEVLRLVEEIFNDTVESYDGTIFAATRNARSQWPLVDRFSAGSDFDEKLFTI